MKFNLILLIETVFFGFFTNVYCQDLLFNLEGQVKGEEFLYYKIVQNGNLLLVLESPVGDCDIYISDKTPAPNYEPENYELHSATCGTDSVFIPKRMKRPIAVGIYGHSSHNISKFSLNVYSMPVYKDHFEVIEKPTNFPRVEEGEEENNVNFRENREGQRVQLRHKKKGVLDKLLPLLELFEMLLFL